LKKRNHHHPLPRRVIPAILVRKRKIKKKRKKRRNRKNKNLQRLYKSPKLKQKLLQTKLPRKRRRKIKSKKLLMNRINLINNLEVIRHQTHPSPSLTRKIQTEQAKNFLNESMMTNGTKQNCLTILI